MSDFAITQAYTYLRECPLTAKQHDEIRVLYEAACYYANMYGHCTSKIEDLKERIAELEGQAERKCLNI